MQKEVERKTLIVSSIINVIITGAGVWVFTATNIQALFLDCFFSFIGLISSMLAVVISKTGKRKTNAYPDGLYFLEPMYAILKSLLTLVLLGFSVVVTSIAAHQYFTHGTGRPMNIDPVLPYTISMTLLCFGLGFYNKFQNRKLNNLSTMLYAESKSNFIDGLQSLGIGIFIIILRLIDVNDSLGFLHYTGDFFVTVILVIISLKQPIKVIITSFKELSHATTCDITINNNINKAVDNHLGVLVHKSKCDIFKIGMHIKIRISLLGEINHDIVHDLVQARQRIVDDLGAVYDSVEVAYVF